MGYLNEVEPGERNNEPDRENGEHGGGEGEPHALRIAAPRQNAQPRGRIPLLVHPEDAPSRNLALREPSQAAERHRCASQAGILPRFVPSLCPIQKRGYTPGPDPEVDFMEARARSFFIVQSLEFQALVRGNGTTSFLINGSSVTRPPIQRPRIAGSTIDCKHGAQPDPCLRARQPLPRGLRPCVLHVCNPAPRPVRKILTWNCSRHAARIQVLRRRA